MNNMNQQREGGFLISKIHQLSQRIFNNILKKNGLDAFNSSQGRIIYAILRYNNIPIHELVRKTQLTKSTLSSHIDNLEKTGYIKRVPSKKDKREIFILSTEKINSVQEEYIRVSKEMTKIFYNGFDDKEIILFEDLLNRCLNNLLGYK